MNSQVCNEQGNNLKLNIFYLSSTAEAEKKFIWESLYQSLEMSFSLYIIDIIYHKNNSKQKYFLSQMEISEAVFYSTSNNFFKSEIKVMVFRKQH